MDHNKWHALEAPISLTILVLLFMIVLYALQVSVVLMALGHLWNVALGITVLLVLHTQFLAQ